MMTPAEIARLRELCGKANAGPWEAYSAVCCPDMGGVNGPKRGNVYDSEVHRYGHPCAIEDAEFIAESRTALPQLLDECERLRRLVSDAEELIPEAMDVSRPAEWLARANQWLKEVK